MNKKQNLRAKRFLSSAIACASLTAFNAEANLLTAGDFEGISSLGFYQSAAAGVWGRENANITTGAFGVTPFDSQMLQINNAGGGSVSQVDQRVVASLTAGTTVSFEVLLNASHSNAVASITVAGRDTLFGADIFSSTFNTSSFGLDSDINTWESFSISGILGTDVNFLRTEIRFTHASLPSGQVGFADNAVLLATPAAVPVPAAVWLFGTGLLGLVGFARRK